MISLAKREFRAIEGYSIGGYSAAIWRFKYPDTFSVAGVNAGALVTPRASVLPPIFERTFGSDDAYVQANDPFVLLRKNVAAIRGHMAIPVSVVGDDSLLPRNRASTSEMKMAAGKPLTLTF